MLDIPDEPFGSRDIIREGPECFGYNEYVCGSGRHSFPGLAGKVFQQVVYIPMEPNCVLFKSTYLSSNMKQNLYTPCSRWKENNWHFGSFSYTGNRYFENYLDLV